MDGIETTKIIKKNCKDLPITIIMVSSYSQETVVDAAKKQGIDIFLQKPINPSLLYNVIMDIFGESIKSECDQFMETSSLKKELTTLKGSNILLVEDNVSKSTNRPGTHGEQGTGFGMPLVRKFMKKYGGTIQIASKSDKDYPEDHGTKVCLTFTIA
ncbi:MAG: hypothetical protein OMM_07053 [Candidatus Magnetoglobus multicellularis str. Araruama]|uniref:Response regulatory domain-containing protein n=1 Tax=Candidatus Magnetoglobus multicellularis str. Araruama TaxID=890399 RepID=A0A1V1PER6_9BACT|nr:MAG: hypothetical protein OMM_07053 [Candidatus Magnetoglobus multicellularis str. Araruama]